MPHVKYNSGVSDPIPTPGLRCPYCRQVGVFLALPTKDVDVISGTYPDSVHGRAGVRVCPNDDCKATVFMLDHGDDVRLLPPEVIDFDATSLPATVLESLTEATQCHAVSCYRASAIMIRRTLEEMCADKSATGGNLKSRLTALSATVVLPQELIDGLDALRLLGNDAAHIESREYDQVGEEEVRVAMDVTKLILQAVYQYGDIVSRLTALKSQQQQTP